MSRIAIEELVHRAQQDPELAEAHRRLREHYGEPVMPVRAYCKAFETWIDQLVIKYKEQPALSPPEWMRHLTMIRLSIRKSNLLYRLIYCGEPLRLRKCPLHNGEWSGIEDCEHGCHSTGWLPNEGTP